MPGHNCGVFGCHTNSEKCPTLSFHGLPKKGVSDNSDTWRGDLIKAICRSDKSFNPGNAKICSRHFASDCIVTKSGGRKVLVPGSLLTRFLPETSHQKASETPRKPPTVREPPTVVADLAEVEVPQCPGILNAELQPYASLPDASNNAQYYLHVSYMRVEERMACTTTIRAHGCDWTMETLGKIACDCCLACRPLVVKKFQRDKAAATKDVQKFTPLTKMSKSRVTSALKAERVEKKAALEQLNKIRSQLNEESVRLPNETHEKLSDIVENADKDSFISMFWNEQKKAFSIKANGMRWHPMMVRFAILVHSQSPSTYRTLREIGAIKLPSESTLKDYTNVVHPTSGFSMPVFQELKNMAEPLSDNERWVVLLHDEISIKADLIYDKRTGDLVGFVEQGQWKEESDNLATHALVFMAVGLTSNIKMSLGYFPTTTATADRIFPLFWQAVGLLETVCNLKVIASTSDKASPNQRLVKMHGDSGFKALNMYAPERHIYFFSDAPHLIKTLRNNLSSSGFGKNSKFLWNDGSDLLWSHVKRLYDEDYCREIRRTKLTAEHIHTSVSYACLPSCTGAQPFCWIHNADIWTARLPGNCKIYFAYGQVF